jgi:6-phosphogluconolactonase
MRVCMEKPKIKVFKTSVWPKKAADLIGDKVLSILNERGHCSVMLTGGHSAAKLYQAWSVSPKFHLLAQVSFYFGDERCVLSSHPESNYDLVMRTLFLKGVPEGCSIIGMEADLPDHDSAAAAYERKLPATIDVLLLSPGEDGHIASLFPGDPVSVEMNRAVMFVIGLKSPTERLTITPKVISEAREIFLLGLGVLKGKILAQALRTDGSAKELPVRYVLGATWLLDQAAYQELNRD